MHAAFSIQENVSLKAKTTMRIGGIARYFAEPRTREQLEECHTFAAEKHVPIVVLGGGSNTVFEEGIIDALVIRIKADAVTCSADTVTVESGKILAMLINELAEQGLDLSALTGIPGTVGGAIFGNAGQGPSGIWIDTYVRGVTAFVSGSWKTFTKEECDFRYRESLFKDLAARKTVIIWSATLAIPSAPADKITSAVQTLLQKRIETQPHLKTAGSCFKALPDGTPAWKLIEQAGLRGHTIGDIQVSEKHANFLLNIGDGTYADLIAVTERIKQAVPQIAGIEMRLYETNGGIRA